MAQKKLNIRKEEDKDWIDRMADKPKKKANAISSFRRSRFPSLHKFAKELRSPKFWRNFGLAILLLAWVGLVLTASNTGFKWLFKSILSQSFLVTPLAQGIFTFVVDGVSLLLIVFVPIWLTNNVKQLSKLKEKKSLREVLGLNGALNWTDIALAPIGFALYLVVSIVSQYVMPFIDWNQQQDIGYDTAALFGKDLIIILIAVVIIAPIAEEIIFRGWLYGKMRARIPAWLAMILVSVLFGVMHRQVNVGVNVFFLSMILCLMREMTGTIYAGILLHMLKNGIALALIMNLTLGGGLGY
jgi:membrane protease YdiL (CAAX protease family)